jgi:O-antigen/teichoic acid export membrane protein
VQFVSNLSGMSKTKNNENLTGSRLLARNTIWNIFGQAAPLVVAFISIPLLIEGMGTERFGVLTLTWMLIGYFSLFDFGLGRTLTQFIAEKLGRNREHEVPRIILTALCLMMILSILGSIIIMVSAHRLVYGILKIPRFLQQETLNSVYIISLFIPFVVVTTGLRGILEAYQKFTVVNLLRIPMGMFTFAGPLLILPYYRGLEGVVIVLVGGRVIYCMAHLYYGLKIVPFFSRNIVIRREVMGELLRTGSWMTVSNIISPIMVYLDRFLIGAILSIAAVAYYATPYEIITKFLFIPIAIVGVLFPAFATTYRSDPDRTVQLFNAGLKYIFLFFFPIIITAVAFAPEGLLWWLGKDFADNGTRVLQWLAFGVFLNALAQVPFFFIQGIKRPDITAKLHLFELPVYIILLWVLSTRLGIEGAAIAWVSRMLLDTLVLFYITSVKFMVKLHLKSVVIVSSLSIMSLWFFANLIINVNTKILLLIVYFIVFSTVGWCFVLSSGEREFLWLRTKDKK